MWSRRIRTRGLLRNHLLENLVFGPPVLRTEARLAVGTREVLVRVYHDPATSRLKRVTSSLLAGNAAGLVTFGASGAQQQVCGDWNYDTEEPLNASFVFNVQLGSA